MSSYPIAQPIHGGQKRAQALYQFYTKLFSDVKYVGVFNRQAYPNYPETDLPIAQTDIVENINKRQYFADIIAGEAVYTDVHVRSPLAELLLTYRPHIIQIEQAYTYIGLEKLLNDLGIKPLLIYSAHNVEYKMKESIYSEVGANKKEASEAIKLIRETETKLAQSAELVISVSETDAKEFRRMGAQRIVVIPNGINKTSANDGARSYWQEYRTSRKIERTAVFIGSAHPPNWIGFLDMVGSDLGFLPDGSKIIIAGGVSHYFDEQFSRKANKKLWQGLETTGNLSESILTGLIDTTEIVLLPITSGGGSNLKTAEAILSGKKIVATSFAFRGFEEYKSLPNIYIADTPGEFKKAIVKAFESPYIERSRSDIRLSQRVSWLSCLKPLSKPIRQLALRATPRTVYLDGKHAIKTLLYKSGLKKKN